MNSDWFRRWGYGICLAGGWAICARLSRRRRMAISLRGSMFRLPRLNGRQVLIVIHDLVMTAAALVGTFVVRFEGPELTWRIDGLERLLPGFVIYAACVYFAF